MHRKFNDDIFARCLVIMKNVVISYIKEYRGPTLRPPCDVIDDVIIMKILLFGIIWDDIFISEVKLKLCLIFQKTQTNSQTNKHTGWKHHLANAGDNKTEFAVFNWIFQYLKNSHRHENIVITLTEWALV